jgi:uncharacterized membrane protein
MDQWLVIALRIIHILTGAAWVGGAYLLFGFLIPTSKRLGPVAGSAYLNRFLDHPRFSLYISGVEGIAVLTGLVLFWNASSGFEPAWLTSPTGIGFAIGGAAALIALAVSVPISAALGALYRVGEEIASLSADDAHRNSAFHQKHVRLTRLGNVYVTLLAVAVTGMASARYLS